MPLRFDGERNGVDILLYICWEIPAKLVINDQLVKFSVKPYNPHLKIIPKHLDIISTMLEIIFPNYHYNIFLGDFKPEWNGVLSVISCDSYNLVNNFKQLTCFKNPRMLNTMILY